MLKSANVIYCLLKPLLIIGATIAHQISYLIWWAIVALPINNFVKDNDFTGKTVISFCISALSAISQNCELLAEMIGIGNLLNSKRFSQTFHQVKLKNG